MWDNGLLDQYAPDTKQAVVKINLYLKSHPEAEEASGQVIEWAMQSHDQTRDHAYRFGSYHRLDEQYVKQALPVVEAQLGRAGVRLAQLLNTAMTNGAARLPPSDHSVHAAP